MRTVRLVAFVDAEDQLFWVFAFQFQFTSTSGAWAQSTITELLAEISSQDLRFFSWWKDDPFHRIRRLKQLGCGTLSKKGPEPRKGAAHVDFVTWVGELWSPHD